MQNISSTARAFSIQAFTNFSILKIQRLQFKLYIILQPEVLFPIDGIRN